MLSVLALPACIAAFGIASAVLRVDTPNSTIVLVLPHWAMRLTEQNSVAYPAHATVGTVLGVLRLSPSVTAVQWFKAAAHAESTGDLEQAAQGIAVALKRDSQGDARRTLCGFQDLANMQQMRALVWAGAWCDRSTPNVDLEASIAPPHVRAGSSVRIVATVTSAISVSGLVDLEIHDTDARKVAQWLFPDQDLVAEHRNRYAVTWIVPLDTPPGEYAVKLGVFRRGGAVIHGWKNSAATLTVTP
jgi:hypothetical protein